MLEPVVGDLKGLFQAIDHRFHISSFTQPERGPAPSRSLLIFAPAKVDDREVPVGFG